LSLLLILGHVPAGLTADFPTKPIKYIVPFAPGGNTDIMARLVAKPLEKELGTKIYVENIPGGGTKVGTTEVMKARPDGYTIMQATEIAWLGLYYSKALDIKVWEKLTPLVNIATESTGLWVVRAESPFKTWAEFIKAAKAKPEKLTCGLSSRGAMDIVATWAEKASGIELKHVPFTGAGPVGIALLGGHIDIQVCSPSETITMIRAGKTRGIAMQTEKRHPALPEVPTFKEMGLEVMGLAPTRSIWGPPNMPKNIVNIFVKAIERAVKDPEFVKAVEETFLNKVEFRSGPKMIEEGPKHLEKVLGSPLTEFYK
jgi:tripartite-type tricarboxylate transporter receptor subunit TctC